MIDSIGFGLPIQSSGSPLRLVFLGLHPWTEPGLCALTGLSVDFIGKGLESLSKAGKLIEVPIGPRRFVRILPDVVADLEDRVLRALGRLHAAKPRLSAIPRAHLSAALPDLGSESLISGIVDRLRAEGKVIVETRTVAVKGYEPKLSQGERRLKNELVEAIRNGGMSPPETAELSTYAGARAAVVPELLALLRDEQKLVEVSPSVYIGFDVEAELRRKVAEHLVHQFDHDHGRSPRPAGYNAKIRSANWRVSRPDRLDETRR